LVSLPFWSMLALVFWNLVYMVRPALDDRELDLATWQGIVFTWMLGLAWFLVAGILGYAIWQRRTAREAMLLLQDVVWRETSRDQRRIARALARARLSAAERKNDEILAP